MVDKVRRLARERERVENFLGDEDALGLHRGHDGVRHDVERGVEHGARLLCVRLMSARQWVTKRGAPRRTPPAAAGRKTGAMVHRFKRVRDVSRATIRPARFVVSALVQVYKKSDGGDGQNGMLSWNGRQTMVPSASSSRTGLREA